MGTLRSEGGDIGGGSETLAVARMRAFGDYEVDGTESAMKARDHKDATDLVIQAQGADVYNGEVTGDTAATVTSATGIANASGPKVVGWNGDVTPKSSEDVSVTLRSQQGGEGVGVAAFGHNIQAYEGKMPPLRAGDDRGNTSFVAQQEGPCYENHSGDSRITDSGEISPTLRKRNGTGGGNLPLIKQESPQMNPTLDIVDGETVEGMCEMRGSTMVRRLTPMECERLQGFPDGWTSKRMELELEGNEWKPTGKVEEQKDGPRYRQMGNAVSVPVAEYIGRRMAEAVDE